MKNDPKKIVIVFSNLNIGGIETKIVDLCNYYSTQKNIKIFLLLKSKTGPLLPLVPKNISIKNPNITSFFKIRSLLFPFWLAGELKQINPNLIIAFGNYSAISASIGNFLSHQNKSLIISEDSSIIEQLKSDTFSFLRKILVKATYPTAAKIIVLTKVGQQKLCQLTPSLKDKIIILSNWLPLSFPTKNKIQKKDIDILFLGRFEPQKNPLKFLEVSKALIKTSPKINIAMVGYGSLKSDIQNYISKNNLSQNIDVYPATTKPYDYFQRSKILLLTSDHEGFPLTLLESTASKCLPVTRDLAEIKKYFDFQPDKILYKKSTEAAKKIKYLLKNPKTIRLLSTHYRQKTLDSQLLNFQKTVNLIYKYL